MPEPKDVQRDGMEPVVGGGFYAGVGVLIVIAGAVQVPKAIRSSERAGQLAAPPKGSLSGRPRTHSGIPLASLLSALAERMLSRSACAWTSCERKVEKRC